MSWGLVPDKPVCGCSCHVMGGTTCTDCDHLHQASPVAQSSASPPSPGRDGIGTKDGTTAADNDKQFDWGQQPTTAWPRPFTQGEFARLLIMRGRVRAEKDKAA